MRFPEYNIFSLLFVTRKAAIFFMLMVTFYYVRFYNQLDNDDIHEIFEDANTTRVRAYSRGGLNNSDGLYKVLFFSYIRGGSSIGSEILDIDDRAMFWYEPLEPFYFATTGYFGRKCQKVYLDTEEAMLRPMQDWEVDRLIYFMENIYNCRLPLLPIESKVHRFLMHTSALQPYVSCYEKNSADSIIWDLIYCRRMLQDACGMSVETAVTNRCPEIMEAIHLASNINMTNPSRTLDFRLSEDDQRRIITTYLNSSGYDPDRLQTYLPQVMQYRTCLDDLEEVSTQCLPFAAHECPKKQIRAAKIVRATLQPVARLLESVPDLRIIFFVRDPRAVALSRSSKSKPKNQVLRNFLKLCMKMRADIYYKQEIEKFFPGSITVVRYEDFVVDPKASIGQMYAHIGLEPPPQTLDFVKTHLYAGADDGLKFGDIRANASHIADRWRRLVTDDLMFKMQQACPDILQTLNYVFY